MASTNPARRDAEVEVAHDLVSPSTLWRRWRCAGSAGMEGELRDSPTIKAAATSGAAREGSTLHEFMEIQGLHLVSTGEPAPLPEDALTPEQRGLLEQCIQWVKPLLLGQCRPAPGAPAGNHVAAFFEQRLELLHKGRRVTGGIADLVSISRNQIDVVDYKFGRGEPDIESAIFQGGAYSAMVAQRYWRRKWHPPVIFQAYWPRWPEVRCQEVFNPDRIHEATDSVAAIVDHCEELVEKGTWGQNLYPSASACRWCLGRLGHCVEFVKWGASLPAEIEGHSSSGLVWIDKLDRWLSAAYMLGTWSKNFKDLAKGLPESALTEAGWEVRTTPGARKISDLQAAFWTFESMGLEPYDVIRQASIPLRTFERLVIPLVRKKENLTEAGAKARVYEILEEAGCLTRGSRTGLRRIRSQ